MMTLESMLDDTYTEMCHRCTGAGHVYPGREAGQMARKQRVGVGMSLRRAAELMGVTAVLLGELERGKRPWSAAMVARFDLAIGGAK